MFEYKIHISPRFLLTDGILNNYGQEGWELISVFADTDTRQMGTSYIYHFKRFTGAQKVV